ncbi:sigma-70 family RNA polymerase sigma factor [Streptomyces sp. NPDC058653]|uniref:sigma-70 family RNA polymerase sigma factor n=1 Tax=Streptomyces sp. NPDC058653 TaxID=3346576 RepID=UPI0036648985
MDESSRLLDRFEEDRPRLRAVAYRMLGSASEADDAVQETWLRLDRADTREVGNLRGWLTTVVARVCLNMLRTRASRREEPLDAPDRAPIGARGGAGGRPGPDGGPGGRSDRGDPEEEALLADSVGLALLVVLDTLAPAERLAFVLHDMFAVPFDEIAPMIERTPAAARQLASRARRRVRGASPVAEPDLARRREVVEAFLAASRGGDFEALVALLDADVILRADRSAGPTRGPITLRGAQNVGKGASVAAERVRFTQPALVNGSPGLVMAPGGRLFLVLAFTIADRKVTEIDIIADAERLAGVEVAVLDA